MNAAQEEPQLDAIHSDAMDTVHAMHVFKRP